MTGSFKEHGAANILLALYDGERRRGVIAPSAGNHGLAVAFRAARVGVRSVIVMPEWAPLTKVTAARRHGAEVILHGDNYDDSYECGREIVTEHGLIFIHPFDDPQVIAGQGTIALRSSTSVSGSKARRLSCCSAGATSTATSSPASARPRSS
jgi:threonine dehydratase